MMLRSLSARLLAVTLAALIVGAIVSGGLALDLFERQLAPEMSRKAEAIGKSVATQLVRALDYGIPLKELRGVEALLDQTLADHAELRYVAVADADGAVVFRRGAEDEATESRIALRAKAGPVGEVRVGVDPGFARAALADVALDVAVVLLVALLAAFELIHFLSARRRSGAPAGAAAIRLPLFLFVAAEEMSRSFLPLYARELYGAGAESLPPEVAVGLPIVAFMAVVALGQPAAGAWSERLGRRASFLLGAVVAAIGLMGSGLGVTLWHLLAARVATGLGYGLVFVACQGYVVDSAPRERRAQAMAVFVGAIMAAAICGPAIGGVLADRLGFRVTLALSAALAVASAGFVLRGLDETRVSAAPAARLRDAAAALRNVRFLALAFAAAAPAKIILTGFVFYLAPIRLAALGASPAMIGRALMLYGVLMLALSPLAARLADRWRERAGFVAAGGVISGAAALAPLASDPLLGLIVAILGLGAAQAISISAQLALVPEVAAAECRAAGQGPVFGLFRLIERSGSAAGPFIAAALLMSFGPDGAAVGLGAVAAGGAAVFAAVLAFDRRAAARRPAAA